MDLTLVLNELSKQLGEVQKSRSAPVRAAATDAAAALRDATALDERALTPALDLTLAVVRLVVVQDGDRARALRLSRTCARATDLVARGTPVDVGAKLRLGAAFELCGLYEESRGLSLQLIPLLEAAGRTKALRMQLHMLCHALQKLEKWDELKLWSDRLLADAQADDDWRSQLLALEHAAQCAEAMGGPAEALRALEAEQTVLEAHKKKSTSPAALHLREEIERLRSLVSKATIPK